MIYIDDVQTSPEEVAKLFKVDLKKITKYGVFEINPKKKRKDRLNGGHRFPAGKNIICHFWAVNKETGKTHSIRYADRVDPQVVGTAIMNVYTPKKLQFPGEEFHMILQHDKALFFFLSRDCMDSPFYVKGKPFYYYLQDKEQEARLRVQSTGRVFEAMALLQGKDKLPEARLRMLAKGIGISGVDQMDDELILIDSLMQVAEKDPEKFIMDAKSKNTSFYGTLQNLIDKGAITFKSMNGMDRWFWGAGALSGQEIIHVDKNANAFESLKAYIVDNAQSLFKMVYDLDSNVNTDDKLNKFLQQQQEQDDTQIDLQAKYEREKGERENRERIQHEQHEENMRILSQQQDELIRQQNVIKDENIDLGNTGSDDINVDTDLKDKKDDQDLGITDFASAVEYLTKRDGNRPSNIVAANFLKEYKSQRGE